MKLLRVPANDGPMLFRDRGRIPAGHLFEHRYLTIAVNELHRNTEVQQTCDCFTRHRAWDHVTSGHQAVYFCLTNLLEYCLEGWKIPMNVVYCSDPHDSLWP